jgi:hypothetical protein
MSIPTAGGGLVVGSTSPIAVELARQDNDDRPLARVAPAGQSLGTAGSGGSPTAELSPTSLSFVATLGRGNPLPQVVLLTNSGTGRLLFSVTPDATWLRVTPPQSWAPAALTITALIGLLPVGVYSSQLTLVISEGSTPLLTIPVTLTITA